VFILSNDTDEQMRIMMLLWIYCTMYAVMD